MLLMFGMALFGVRFGLRGRKVALVVFHQGFNVLGVDADYQVLVGLAGRGWSDDVVPAKIPVHAEEFTRHALGQL